MTAVPVERATMLSDRVAEEIRVLLTRRRMSQRQLALALEVSPAWLNYRLTGVQEIGLNDLARIARVFGVSVASLLPPDVREEPQTIVGLLRPAEKVSGKTFRPLDNRPNGRPKTSSTIAVRRTSRLPRDASKRAA